MLDNVLILLLALSTTEE